MKLSLLTKLYIGSFIIAGTTLVPAVSQAYDDLEIEIDFDDGRIEVDVDYDENGREVEKEYVFNTTNLDEAYRLTADKLGISVSAVKDAVVRIDRDDDEDDDDDDRDDRRDDDDDDDRWGKKSDDKIKDADYYRDSTRTDALEAIADAKEEIADAERYLNRVGASTAATADLKKARALVAEAEAAYDAGKWGDSERKADEAEAIAERISRGQSGSWSDTRPVSVSSSQDRAELQRQLMVLLQQLIVLLQAQQSR